MSRVEGGGMIGRRLWLGLLSLFIVGCAGREPLVPEATRRRLAERGIVTEQVREDDLLCAINHPEGSEWFLAAGGVLVNEKLGENLSAMGEVVALERSADGRYLAVISVGEGHPVLDVVALPRLLKEGDYRVLREIDPYHGGISIERWDGERLIVRCDMLLTRRGKDGRVPTSLELDPAARFALSVDTGEVAPLSRHARHPVRYYRRGLRSRFAGERALSATALRTLGARSALPELRQALAAEQDPAVRADIQATVDELGR